MKDEPVNGSSFCYVKNMHHTKIVVLRGPSGSGKSTVAKELRKHLKDTTALIEQDYLRRVILKEKDKLGGVNAKLILETAKFALEHGYHLILEGMFKKAHYAWLFDELWRIHPADNYVYYFDIPFEETLRRHTTKPNAQDWGETEMRAWWLEDDLLGIPGEQKILQDSTIEQSVELILKDMG